MNFDWLESTPRLKTTREATCRESEIATRAFLLARLGYSKKEATRRMKDNVSWEYEGLGKPRINSRINALVNDAYRRAGATTKGRKRSS